MLLFECQSCLQREESFGDKSEAVQKKIEVPNRSNGGDGGKSLLDGIAQRKEIG